MSRVRSQASTRDSIRGGAAPDRVGREASPSAAHPDPHWLWRCEHAGSRYELCAGGVDFDLDGLAGCDDPDCWALCTPGCPPGATCDPAFAHCGDGVCNANLESSPLCPADCGTAPEVCGDYQCGPAETAATCPGDCGLP